MPTPDAVLLDTHALIWWQARSTRLSAPARRAIESARNVLVSPISCWEVAMLVAKGRIALDRPVDAWCNDLFDGDGPVGIAELTPSVAVAAGQIQDLSGDPADRLIYATARSASIPLITKDPLLRNAAKADKQVVALW